MRILGTSAFYHDSAAALLVDGRIVAAAQEERFTRKKQDARFPISAIGYCLEEGGITLDDVDYVAFYEKPFIKFERLLETYVAFAPRGFQSFSTATRRTRWCAYSAIMSSNALLRRAVPRSGTVRLIARVAANASPESRRPGCAWS